MKRILIVFAVIFIFLCQVLLAEDVIVGLEPFPPLITEDGGGYTIDMLKAIEAISDLNFEITIMPYVRGKESLKNGSIDLMGHTPYQNEVKEFYEYAQELKWTIEVETDFYSSDKNLLIQPAKYKIGTPRGNKEFLPRV